MIDRAETLRRLVLNAARFSGAARMARPLLGGVGAILMLHRVTEAAPKPLGLNSHLSITPRFLDALIIDMKRQGYEFVGMDEVARRLRQPNGGQPFAAITADDGYRDNLLEALPILEKHRAPIAIYVAPGLVRGDADLWWDVLEEVVLSSDGLTVPAGLGGQTLDCATRAGKVKAYCTIAGHLMRDVAEEEQRPLVRELAARAGVDPQASSRASLMNWEEIKRAAAHDLVTIGAHTIHHYSLKRLIAADAFGELDEAARLIAVRTGYRPRHMAYPYGTREAVGAREVDLAGEAGFTTAVTTRHGVLHAGHAAHLLALPRISVNGRYQHVAYFRTMLSGITTAMANAGRRLVTV